LPVACAPASRQSRHSHNTVKGILLINLGSPDSTTVPDVRLYLREFLMDGRVLDVPWLPRWFIVNCAILPKRPYESAEAYEKIWTPQGSPLVATGRAVQRGLEARAGMPVELAMRYRNPSVKQALANLMRRGVDEVYVFPLFPHYAMSSFETAVEHVRAVAARHAPHLRLRCAEPYFDEPEYIGALVESAADYLREDFDHLLFSFHGVPERHLRKGGCAAAEYRAGVQCCKPGMPSYATCYRAQCLATADAFVRAAALPRENFSVAFQSRLGRDPWMRPYTDMELKRLAVAGVKKLLVICPAFTADCLETLEEIAMRGRETFIEAGGTEFRLIPCLNERPAWLDALAAMVRKAFGDGVSSAAPPRSQRQSPAMPVS